MNMLEEKVLGIIEKNSRVSTREMAVVLGTEEIDVINALQNMEDAGIICGYHTMIDWDKTDRSKLRISDLRRLRPSGYPGREISEGSVQIRLQQAFHP